MIPPRETTAKLRWISLSVSSQRNDILLFNVNSCYNSSNDLIDSYNLSRPSSSYCLTFEVVVVEDGNGDGHVQDGGRSGV